ncbi:hypothetical protein ABGV42_01505 [Paenibacillus pabuli]|uniref:hypothetical protein n=1 Tax=Paenibacillus pabuli TaxID=1472 RepID=UPI003242FA10
MGEHKLYNTYGEDVGHAILFSGFENDHFVLLCDTDVVFVQPNHVSWTKGNEKHTIEVGSVVTHDDKPFEWYYSPDDSIIKLFN